VTPGELEASIPPGEALLLDTSAVLAYLSGSEAASSLAASIVDGFISTARNSGLISAITVTEALVRPLRAASPTAAQLVEDFLFRFPNLRVEPVTAAVAREAARIRAATAARTADALILATAVVAPTSIVVGNDAAWPGVAKRAGLGIRVLVLG
jgi:predicted nucleic acid-binding protein